MGFAFVLQIALAHKSMGTQNDAQKAKKLCGSFLWAGGVHRACNPYVFPHADSLCCPCPILDHFDAHATFGENLKVVHCFFDVPCELLTRGVVPAQCNDHGVDL